MKKFAETKLILPPAEDGRRSGILAFTDLHFNRLTSQAKLDKMLELFAEVVKRENLHYIFFAGDLLENLNVLDDTNLRQKLCEFLKNLGEILPMIMVLGNHDQSTYRGKAAFLDLDKYNQLRQALRKVPNLYLLGDDEPIFDDGKIRVLGVDLPPEAYHFANYSSNQAAEVAFQEKMLRLFPQLKAVPEREYYILLHSVRFLRSVEIDPDVVVLSGHMHSGLVPPGLDKVLKFNTRGLVGPGFQKKPGRKPHYEWFPWNARLRPKAGRMWITLTPVRYLPEDRLVSKVARFYPEISYTVIKGEML